MFRGLCVYIVWVTKISDLVNIQMFARNDIYSMGSFIFMYTSYGRN